MARRPLGRDERRRRQARRLGTCGLLMAAVLPWVLWHRAIAIIAHEFRLDVGHLSGWAPWVLIVLGLAFLVPVAWSVGRDPESRLYPRARNAYAGWGVSLYLLGCALAAQVAQIVHLHAP